MFTNSSSLYLFIILAAFSGIATFLLYPLATNLGVFKTKLVKSHIAIRGAIFIAIPLIVTFFLHYVLMMFFKWASHNIGTLFLWFVGISVVSGYLFGQSQPGTTSTEAKETESDRQQAEENNNNDELLANGSRRINSEGVLQEVQGMRTGIVDMFSDGKWVSVKNGNGNEERVNQQTGVIEENKKGFFNDDNWKPKT